MCLLYDLKSHLLEEESKIISLIRENAGNYQHHLDKNIAIIDGILNITKSHDVFVIDELREIDHPIVEHCINKLNWQVFSEIINYLAYHNIDYPLIDSYKKIKNFYNYVHSCTFYNLENTPIQIKKNLYKKITFGFGIECIYNFLKDWRCDRDITMDEFDDHKDVVEFLENLPNSEEFEIDKEIYKYILQFMYKQLKYHYMQKVNYQIVKIIEKSKEITDFKVDNIMFYLAHDIQREPLPDNKYDAVTLYLSNDIRPLYLQKDIEKLRKYFRLLNS